MWGSQRRGEGCLLKMKPTDAVGWGSQSLEKIAADALTKHPKMAADTLAKHPKMAADTLTKHPKMAADALTCHINGAVGVRLRHD